MNYYNEIKNKLIDNEIYVLYSQSNANIGRYFM